MILYKKLPCVCGHTEGQHKCGPTSVCLDCHCFEYDPAGHNPELENLMCTRCGLARFEKPIANLYVCPQCGYAVSEAVVLRIVG
jgi:hypothetical protein